MSGVWMRRQGTDQFIRIDELTEPHVLERGPSPDRQSLAVWTRPAAFFARVRATTRAHAFLGQVGLPRHRGARHGGQASRSMPRTGRASDRRPAVWRYGRQWHRSAYSLPSLTSHPFERAQSLYPAHFRARIRRAGTWREDPAPATL
jgi:hypothetical protein